MTNTLEGQIVGILNSNYAKIYDEFYYKNVAGELSNKIEIGQEVRCT